LVPTASAQYISVELTLEAFDGCGCQPLDPPNCGSCQDLNGSGCNCHDGNTNNPQATVCASGTGWPHPFPNMDVYGADSLDQDFWNQGYPVDYSADYQIKNGVEPADQASQHFELRSGSAFSQIESANIGYISPENPQDKVQGFGRMLIDQILQEYNLNHPGTPLPDPVAGQPVVFAFDVRRVGDGFGGQDPQNPTLKMRADFIAVNYQSVPSGLVWTWAPESERMIPNDAQWHTYHVVQSSDWAQKVYMGIGIRLDASSRPYPANTTEKVDVWIDNVRVIYKALPLPENCSNGFDDDGDGLADCADPDCYFTPDCPCNPHVVFDVDNDGDVDQADFGFLQTCVTGTDDPGNLFGTLPAGCQCLDVTGPGGEPDNAIDQQDLNLFELCASGPGILASPTCDD
jgi:hypothetical protein